MKNPRWLLIVLVALLSGFFLGRMTGDQAETEPEQTEIAASENGYDVENAEKELTPELPPATETEKSQSTPNEIPAKVYQVLEYVRVHGMPMKGYVGGRDFHNYEERLPKADAMGDKITYREWDVNAKTEGQDRGAERLVTGSDGRSWYTKDHYESFIQIK